jgi:hypothetical protein
MIVLTAFMISSINDYDDRPQKGRGGSGGLAVWWLMMGGGGLEGAGWMVLRFGGFDMLRGRRKGRGAYERGVAEMLGEEGVGGAGGIGHYSLRWLIEGFVKKDQS